MFVVSRLIIIQLSFCPQLTRDMAKSTEDLRKLAADANRLLKQKEAQCGVEFAETISKIAVDRMVAAAREGNTSVDIRVDNMSCTFGARDQKSIANNYISDYLANLGFKGVRVDTWCNYVTEHYWTTSISGCTASLWWPEPSKPKSFWK